MWHPTIVQMITLLLATGKLASINPATHSLLASITATDIFASSSDGSEACASILIPLQLMTVEIVN